MLMLQYPLYDFLATVPSCPETTTLAVVLEILEKEQCDRLVVVNQNQHPVGLLYSGRLIPKLFGIVSGEIGLNLQHPISRLSRSVMSSLQTIPASEQLENLHLFLCNPKNQNNRNLDWALIDSDGKFLGLLDHSRLLSFFAQDKVSLNSNSMGWDEEEEINELQPEYYQTQDQLELRRNPLIELLEKLPWPLMLQTSKGEVISKNPAWWQQLGSLKDPEGIRLQVETILSSVRHKNLEYIKYPNSNLNSDSDQGNNNFSVNSSNHQPTSLLRMMGDGQLATNSTSSHCFLDAQQGTCTCVVDVHNGQERVWQFAKIPLDSSELTIWRNDVNGQITSDCSGSSKEDLCLVLATDITEQQKLFKELAAKNADLIQLNRLKDEFLACISHELKTPLTAVLGLSRLLADQQLGKLNERQARYAALIHQSGRHLMSVVNDILDLTRMETGQMELTPAPVKIREVCDRALSEAKTTHSQPNNSPPDEDTDQGDHHFSLTIEPGLEEITADELRLRQMLVHLLSNAFKFTETGGEIGLRVNRWEGWVAFTVWDTGIGIPEHQQHLIFQKFQQLENPLTRQFEGTGLGLVLTRALARLHGGDVSFLSREGKGSQFTLLLPPSPPNNSYSESETAVTETHQPTSSQRLILVVEAVARYIEDLSQHLKNLGYRVVIARSGTEALEKARRLQPKAIFLNPLLPLLSGWDVLTLLKSDSATGHIPVIVTATEAEKEQAYAHRADGVLNLPVKHQALTPILDRLCTQPELEPVNQENHEIETTKIPLRILRLVNPHLDIVDPQPALREHRVIEVDNLEQAELLARVWQFDVMLLDVDSDTAENYLQKLIKYPRLMKLPLVTCDVATTLIASQIPGLGVFPCLTPLGQENSSIQVKPDPLLSVLQIASHIGCPPQILVVDLAMLIDLPQVKIKPVKSKRLEQKSFPKAQSSNVNEHEIGFPGEKNQLGAEWFQALIQYLQTAGLKAAMGNCWSEILQQLRHRSIDLLLICVGEESAVNLEVQKALQDLFKLSVDLPPVLVIDQRLNEVNKKVKTTKKSQPKSQQTLNTLSQLQREITTEVLPRSISMADLLTHIHQTLGEKF
jgi:signal transduction histidine kinase/CheY-like chemotaxis protein